MIILVERNRTDGVHAQSVLMSLAPSPACLIAETSMEAIELARENQVRDPVRLVLLNIDLEDGSAFAILRGLSESDWLSGIPIVCVAAGFSGADLLRAYELGARSLLRRPANEQECDSMLTLAATYWLRVNMTVHEEEVHNARH